MTKLIALLFLAAFGACHSVSAAETRPNIVFILADDLGWSDTSIFGTTKFYQTPNIQRLAQRGMLFRNAYSASPLCSPTRASILTGLAPARIGITEPNCHLAAVVLEKGLAKGGPNQRVLVAAGVTRLKTDYRTLPEALREAGYATGHFGKWHLGAEPYSPLQHGFDVDVPHTPGPGPGGGNGYFAPWQFWKGEGKPGDHIEERMAEEAMKFLHANKDRPFFLNYWAFSVHSPWMAKPSLVADAARRMEPGAAQRHPVYAAMVQSLDDAVGRLLDTLDELKLADRTLVVFTSDNGGWHNVAKEATNNPAFAGIPVTSNAPLRSGKASNYEGGTRVPLVVAWPQKIAAAAKSDALFQSTDFFPTLLDACGLKPQAGQRFDGVSQMPALLGTGAPREVMFSHFPHGGRADIEGFLPGTWVRRGDWKLIRFHAANDDGSDRLELYNLAADLGETKNLAAEKQELAAELNTLIAGFLKDTDAVVPKLNPAYKAATVADPLDAWKPRGCEAAVAKGVLTVTGKSDAPFLGVGAGKLAGRTIVKFRARSTAGGGGKVEWLPTPPDPGKAKSVAFQLSGGDWQEVTVELPAEGPLGIVRLYLPASAQPVEIDWIELKGAGAPKRWDF